MSKSEDAEVIREMSARTNESAELNTTRPITPADERGKQMAETLLRDYRRWLSERKT